jgi:hypothetical protein
LQAADGDEAGIARAGADEVNDAHTFVVRRSRFVVPGSSFVVRGSVFSVVDSPVAERRTTNG